MFNHPRQSLTSGCGTSLRLHLLADGDAIRCDEDDDAHDTYDNNGNDDDNDNGGDTGNGKGDGNDHYSSFCVWWHCFGHFSLGFFE